MTLVLVMGVFGVAPATAVHDVVTNRFAGDDRYATAAQLATATFPGGTDTAVIATGTRFPDALAGTSLSGAAQAPILLVAPDRVPEVTAATLDDLGVENVYLLGGPEAVSNQVEAQLAEGRDLARLAGPDRFATAADIAVEVGRLEDQLGQIAGLTTAFVVTGSQFPDALAVGPLAVTRDRTFPILLVGQDHYPEATRQAIADLGIEQAIIVGGTAAIGQDVQVELEQDLTAVLRVAGTDRHATAVAVADFAMSEFGFDGRFSMLTRSDDFPDALAAGLRAGQLDAPLLLTPPDTLAGPPADWLQDLCPAVEVINAVGGTRAIATPTLEHAQTHAENCHAAEGQTGETYRVEPTTPVAAPVGDSVNMTVRDRYDDRPMSGPKDVALFPCDNVDLATGTFVDADDDGLADGFASTATGAARISSAPESDQVEPNHAHGLHQLHGAYSWTLTAEAPDCTVAVIFDNIDIEGLTVDAQGHPLEHHGMRLVQWSSDG